MEQEGSSRKVRRMKVEVKKVVLDRSGVRKLLQSDDVMKTLKDNANIVGEIDTNFVGFDRCHVIVKDENNAYRDNNS